MTLDLWLTCHREEARAIERRTTRGTRERERRSLAREEDDSVSCVDKCLCARSTAPARAKIVDKPHCVALQGYRRTPRSDERNACVCLR
eukprot:CAMPEP_0185546224 /NCGR_PEP_ID=MMETSP1381-20130426/5332_1 /TAXON_ID=298111 /ORGANISM="Pavlova sp., Strain CCMP459" /LENGTH=88 /DNA_ID=CAMNT_0028158639 /DNA_START=17 /DNA_END=283 /DNA_ORIENTATION=-